MSKLTAVAFVATGYVLGARAGRERYEQIVDRANRVWKNPKVQKGVTDAEQVAKDKAPQVQQKIADVASKAAQKGPKKWSKSRAASDLDEKLDYESADVKTDETDRAVTIADIDNPTGDGADSSTGSSSVAPGRRRAAQPPGGE